MRDIDISVTDVDGDSRTVACPTDLGLSLMEALKANDYPILATCGGMALCGTCHVLIEYGLEVLIPPAEAEMAMLDSLPAPRYNSRLACQIRLTEGLDGIAIRLAPQE